MPRRLETRAETILRVKREFDGYGDSILLTEIEAAAVAGLSEHTLKAWRLKGSAKGPDVEHMHGMVRYRAGKLRDWCAATADSAA